MVSYHSVFSIGRSPPSEETAENIILPSGYAGGPTICLRHRLRERKSREISPTEIISLACQKYAVPQEYPAKRRIQASDPEDTALVTFLFATSSVQVGTKNSRPVGFLQ